MTALHDVEAVLLAASWIVCMVFFFMAGQIAAARQALAAKERLFMAAKSAIGNFLDGRKKHDGHIQGGISGSSGNGNPAAATQTAEAKHDGSAAKKKPEASLARPRRGGGAGGRKHVQKKGEPKQ